VPRQRHQGGFQVRPLAAATFSSAEDRAAAAAKLGAVADLGFDLISLSFDDTDKKLNATDAAAYASYDDAVIDFSQAVLASVHQHAPEVTLGWVPNDYFSNAEGAPVSLALAGERLPPYVVVGWTGNEVLPATISSEDADRAATWLKRKPLLGDNYPVIDHAGDRVQLGPVTGRAHDLAPHLAGMLFNPMPYAWASLPALASCATSRGTPGNTTRSTAWVPARSCWQGRRGGCAWSGWRT